ncbi:MAG TPA: aminotransferase class I/II-fold pyridoxal phosphate-dependent enzyme [Micromonosporaceae bacterium]|nr:aminotransferase class I/II-fold pyridoxal phosphate-dependent enzyme [Micromonosporaceae bacterium]
MAAHYQFSGRTAAEISASIETGIRTAALPAGAALPPVRTLAGQLAVSPATVAKAYQTLRQRGLIETAGRHGTRIRARPPVTAQRSALRLAPPPGALDLSIGEPDRRLLPPLGPHLAAVATQLGSPVGYPDTGVLPELATLARQRLAADNIPAETLTVTGGALDGIERLLTAHLQPGDPVAVEDPGWTNLLDLIAALGLQPVGMPVDDAGPTPAGLAAALDAGARAIVITSRAHNPTGAALTPARTAELRQLLAAHPDRLLIEDDHAAELAPVPLQPLAGTTQTWAFIRSMSKPYGPDLRLAVLAGDEATIARVTGRMRLGTGWVSTLLQQLTVRLWQAPIVAAQIAAARDSYQRRRRALRTALEKRGVATRGHTGINVWVPVPDETRTVAALRDAGYVVAPGSLYRIATGPGIRITVSPLDDNAINPLAGAVAEAVRAGAPTGFSA